MLILVEDMRIIVDGLSMAGLSEVLQVASRISDGQFKLHGESKGLQATGMSCTGQWCTS